MSKTKILVIDDEPQIQRTLKIALESNEYQLWQADTGKEGVLLAASHTPELILLDIGLPDKNGHEVLKELRTWYDKAIIILSVQNSETDIVNALDSGATDYLTKPFRTGELLARIRSALRRNQKDTTTNILESGKLWIDLSTRTVKKNGEFVRLTVTEFNLLSLFIRNEGRALTHQYILKEIWGVGSQTDTQYLRVFVGTLRKKIEDNPNQPAHVLTESGVGYRFM